MRGQLSFIEEEPKRVLMSLREEYYDAMLEGRKHYEYRTRYLKEESEAYIYISKTKKSIVAKIKFGEPIIADANTIALIAEQEEPGSYNGMMEQYWLCNSSRRNHSYRGSFIKQITTTIFKFCSSTILLSFR